MMHVHTVVCSNKFDINVLQAGVLLSRRTLPQCKQATAVSNLSEAYLQNVRPLHGYDLEGVPHVRLLVARLHSAQLHVIAHPHRRVHRRLLSLVVQLASLSDQNQEQNQKPSQ